MRRRTDKSAHDTGGDGGPGSVWFANEVPDGRQPDLRCAPPDFGMCRNSALTLALAFCTTGRAKSGTTWVNSRQQWESNSDRRNQAYGTADACGGHRRLLACAGFGLVAAERDGVTSKHFSVPHYRLRHRIVPTLASSFRRALPAEVNYLLTGNHSLKADRKEPAASWLFRRLQF